MPVIAIAAIRQILVWGVQLGLWSLVDKYALPMVEKAIIAIMEFFGVDEETATDIMANEVIQFFEDVGVNVAIWKSRLPLKLADKLKFTTKGTTKRTLPAKVASKVPTKSSEISKLTTVVKWSAIATGLSFANQTVNNIVNTTDFVAWSNSILQPILIPLARKYNLVPDSVMTASMTTGAAELKKIYNALQVSGVTQITRPSTGEKVTFNSTNLAIIVDEIQGQALLENKTMKIQDMLGALLLLSNTTEAKARAAAMTTEPAATPVAAPATPSVKVFAGVMSQGVLGEKIAFAERQDDLITSMDELTAAAQNNLAPWVASLLGRIIYEVKLVNQVMTKDGTTLRGTTQRIVASYDSKGTPRYKSVTNKFAVMTLYAMTDSGTRTKLAQITLGPTDAVQLQPTMIELANLNSKIGSQAITSDISEVKTIATAQPITITTPQTTLSAAVRTETTQPSTTAAPAAPQPSPQPTASQPTAQTTAAAPAPAVSAPAPSAPQGDKFGAGGYCSATNLSEFYTRRGQSLPSISERGKIYESYGLGSAAYYAGTAEQNARLLGKLQWANGCN